MEELDLNRRDVELERSRARWTGSLVVMGACSCLVGAARDVPRAAERARDSGEVL